MRKLRQEKVGTCQKHKDVWQSRATNILERVPHKEGGALVSVLNRCLCIVGRSFGTCPAPIYMYGQALTVAKLSGRSNEGWAGW